MRRSRWHALVAGTVLAAAGAGLVTVAAARAATPYARDGEATVYVSGAFAQPFVLAFDARMRDQRKNASWSVLTVSLLGGPPPADAVAVGLYPTPAGVHAFTSATRGTQSSFRDTGLSCPQTCRIALRGDRTTFSATVNGREVARWSRFEFSMTQPDAQLDGEVDALGDQLEASLRPVDLVAGGNALPAPACSFTTGGIAVTRAADGTLRYAGRHTAGAPSVYVSLRTGRTGEHCSDVE